MTLFSASLLVLALAADPGVPGPAPRLDGWRVVGPGGGGTMRRPAVSPHDPKVVVEGCDMTGSYITRDGGASWRMFNLGWVVNAYAFDPSAPDVIYAAGSALWRSDDGGRGWAMVFPDPARNTVEHGWGDHADVVYTTDDPLYPSGQSVSVQTVAVDPADSRRLFLALSSTAPGPPGSHPTSVTVLLGSDDRGHAWRRLTEMAAERIFALWVEKEPSPLLRAVGEKAVYEGWGQEWRRFEAPGGQAIESGRFGRFRDTTLLYVTTALAPNAKAPGGIHVSKDGGRTWRGANGTLAAGAGEGGEMWGPAARSRPSLGPIAVSAEQGLTAYVGLRGLRTAPGAPKLNGIAKTADGGRSWTIVHAEEDRPSKNLDPSWIETRALEDGSSVWFDAPYDLAVAPESPDVCYATDLFRTYRTE
ncbi:MAG: hypothetical protein ACREBE_08255, partial [bacterium]